MRVGLIGYPVKHSISHVFQQAAFDELGIDARYELWETPSDRLAEVVQSLRQPEFLGANVTIPHKPAALRLVDDLDQTGRVVGAINTIVRRADGRLAGFNTDVEGFARSVRQDGGTELAGKKVILLGSGGAARAVAASALLNHAAELIVAARRPDRGSGLLNDLARQVAGAATRLRLVALGADPELEQSVRTCDVLVNATPVGMSGHGSQREILIPAAWLRRSMLVCDLVYNPLWTPLLLDAREQGARVLNGLPMLIYQGAAAFERWTSRPAPIELMRQKAMEALDA